MKKNTKINFKKKSSQKRKGFTLLEVLISLMILALGVSTITLLMANNIRNSVESKNQIIASSLAQEGIELLRNLQENNQADFFSDVKKNRDYIIDPLSSYSDFIASYSVNTSEKKLKLTNSGFYIHSTTGTADTKFLRRITFDESPNDITETSTVSWNSTYFPTVCNIANKCVHVSALIPKPE